MNVPDKENPPPRVGCSAWLDVISDKGLGLRNYAKYALYSCVCAGVLSGCNLINQLLESQFLAFGNIGLNQSCFPPERDLRFWIMCSKRIGVRLVAGYALFTGGQKRQERTLPVTLGAAMGIEPSNYGASSSAGYKPTEEIGWIKCHWDWNGILWSLIGGALGGACGSITVLWLTSNEKVEPQEGARQP